MQSLSVKDNSMMHDMLMTTENIIFQLITTFSTKNGKSLRINCITTHGHKTIEVDRNAIWLISITSVILKATDIKVHTMISIIDGIDAIINFFSNLDEGIINIVRLQ